MNTNLPSAYRDLPSKSVEINPPLYPPPQWGTRVVYDETGKKQLEGCKWGEPDDEPPTSRLTLTAPLLGSDSDTDVNVDSDSDEGDSSILRGNDDWAQVSGPSPLFEDINLPVDMANIGMAQDGAGQPPTAPATDFASKDGWLAPMKFTGTSSEDA